MKQKSFASYFFYYSSKLIFTLVILFTAQLVPLFAQNFPEIKKLESKNPVFSQYQDEVMDANKNIAKGIETELNIYSYRATENDTVFTVAARCSITYDTLVTINSIAETGEILDGKTLLLPTVTGIFIPEEPHTTLENLLNKEYLALIQNEETRSYILNGKKFFFLQNRRFTPADRAFFLDSSMCLPLENSVLSSPYGMRVSPISGKWKFHNGIDMAAPEGTSVFASKSGKVTSSGYNETYGLYITITHDNGMKTFYAHLNTISVKKGQFVSGREKIGTVGQSGLATGPHLHFEVVVNGSTEDPEKFF